MNDEMHVCCNEEARDPWGRAWVKTLVQKHGERLFFVALADVMAIGIVYAGNSAGNDTLVGAGIAVLIGSMQLFFNKARGPKNNQSGE